MMGGGFSDSSFTKVTIADGITEIPDYCFNECRNLKQIARNRHVMSGGAGAGFAVATGAPLSAILFTLEEIHKRIQAERVCCVDRQIGVTMTFGFSDGNSEDNNDSLIIAVDKKLYQGKKNGKNQIVK